jgi:hypothetical protein
MLTDWGSLTPTDPITYAEMGVRMAKNGYVLLDNKQTSKRLEWHILICIMTCLVSGVDVVPTGTAKPLKNWRKFYSVITIAH